MQKKQNAANAMNVLKCVNRSSGIRNRLSQTNDINDTETCREDCLLQRCATLKDHATKRENCFACNGSL